VKLGEAVNVAWYGVLTPEESEPVPYVTPFRADWFTVQATVIVVELTDVFGLLIASAGTSVIAKLPDFVGSSSLVALTVIAVPVAGAVTTPAVVMLPPLIDQVYSLEKLFVPDTTAEQLVVPLSPPDAAAQVTATPAIVAGGVVSATVKLPDLVGSCVLVAFTVIEVPVAGAVTSPAAVMLPAETDHVVPLEKVPVPVTVAEQFVIADCAIDAEVQVANTAVMLDCGVSEMA